ncbi:hypothetical protein V6Z11_D02G053100 [Gossypium hirsutum]
MPLKNPKKNQRIRSHFLLLSAASQARNLSTINSDLERSKQRFRRRAHRYDRTEERGVEARVWEAIVAAAGVILETLRVSKNYFSILSLLVRSTKSMSRGSNFLMCM